MAEQGRYIPAHLRRLVIERASERCEYCRLSQAGQAATFHIDHVTPVAAGGETKLENLAQACVSCSLRKSARQKVVDEQSGQEVFIFNPRQQGWGEHFRWEGVTVVGITAIGRATVDALDMNRPVMLAIRTEEIFFYRHPPPE
ncbi:MAG: HNH endonuclease signature motif containing protein [Chloroflexota bacterium]